MYLFHDVRRAKRNRRLFAQEFAQPLTLFDDRQMITMSDVAQRAGVSLSTVSHFLNRTRPLSEKTRQAVLDAIEATGFLDHRLESAVSTAIAVGVVLPSVASPYFSELIDGLGGEAFRRGVDLLIMTTSEDSDHEYRAVDALLSRHVEGIVLIPTTGWTTRTRPLLRRKETPVVLVDRMGADNWDQVGCENESSSEALTGHLMSQGHTRIGYIRGLAGLSTTVEREQGFRKAHQRHGIPLAENYIVEGLSSVRGGRLATEQLLLMENPPTAIYCSNNNMSIGLLTAFRQHNVRVKKDIALVAFDDLEWSDIVSPGITSMAQPFHAMGSKALQLMLERLDKPALTPRVIRLPPSFEHRESCGCLDNDGIDADRPFTLRTQ